MPALAQPVTTRPSTTNVIQKMFELLVRVPSAARADFARKQLAHSSPQILELFDALPREQLSRTVLFLVLQPHTRESRIGLAANDAGWTPVLVHGREVSSRASASFRHHAAANQMFDYVFASWAFPGALVHSFTLSGDQALLIARLKPRRLVLDFYDTCSGMTYMCHGEPEAERSAMGLADGLVHRDLRIRYLQRHQGYPRTRHNLFLYDPLPSKPFVRAGGQPRSAEDPVRVCSTGWIGKPIDSIWRVIEALCRARVHVHAHLNGFESKVPEIVQRCAEFGRTFPTFHLEPTLSGEEYWHALSRYDFGLSLNERMLFGEPLIDVTTDYLAGCGSSRLADYVYARLGVISVPAMRFQHYWSRHYAPACVSATLEWLRNPLPALLEARAQMRNTPPPALDRITTRGVADRLGRFYARVAA